MHELIEKLYSGAELTQSEWLRVLDERRGADDEELFARARAVREKYYGREIFTRGLIEFTNYCKNDCRYCGIRRSSAAGHRYRLTEGEILSCCESGYALGFRTFVLQGGEDPYWTDARLVPLIEQMRRRWPDCAITLSLGERSRGSYEKLYAAGANRYLLRHETADAEHYHLLHPPEMSFANRRRCLRDLKDIGYQVGAGFMVGSPGQTNLCLAKDMVFLQELKPHMVGIGPFIPQHDTPFAKEKAGTAELTLFLLALIRLMLPRVLLPATTALGTIDPRGREKGILAGANVVMPNLSPVNVRGDYQLYDNKICTGEEAAECRGCLERRIASVGCTLSQSRGDFLER
ncbi:MAG: [FeFe] hydrogenase H-cluster radical SAM maturase HydE [Oscillospiraceae bacterium]|nr:[FeFe] hydrogenase H-cluster radical SAM maturase HydE [Oscillospiraceae bacterium]